MDFDKMSPRELRDLPNRPDRAISRCEDRRRREAIRTVENTARANTARARGLDMPDLFKATPRKGGKVAPKYARPESPSLTWPGRGRKPRWVQDSLNAGKSLEDLPI